jgi:ADP-dependent NAD(P)H-hydrate dehydratase
MCASPPDELAGSPTRPLTAELLRTWSLPLKAEDDKHDRGTVLVIAGSVRTPGAALLAGLGALRAGAGRVQIASVGSAAAPLAIAMPEALVQGLPATSTGAIDAEAAVGLLEEQLGQADAVLVGPGFDDPEATRMLLEGVSRLVSRAAVVVLDALALKVLPPDTMSALRGRLVFTPNRQEAPSLVEGDASDLRSGELAAVAARRHGAAVTISGHVASPDGRRWVARSGVPGLGTSGSGDVRAGLVAGVSARCADAPQAACWGTYLHIAAGARLAERLGTVGYLARELLDEVPLVMHEAMPTHRGGASVETGSS